MSWEMVPFIKVCNIQGGTQPPKSMFLEEEQEGYIRLLQIQDFKRSDKAVFVPDRKTLKKCNEDDILIGRYGASVGKILTGLKGAYNVALVKTVPNLKKLNKKYLYHFLRSPCFQNYILNVGSRAAQAGFNKDDLAGLQIPLPPLPEQQRIADILDKAEAITQKREQALALCDEFLRATFLDMFGDPVSNPKGWNTESIGNLTSVLTGSTPSRKVAEYYEGDNPWVKTTEVNGKDIYDTSEKISDKAILESSCKLVPKDSIVMAMYGQGKTRGQVARLKVEAATNQACAVITPTNKIDMDYLYLYLLNSYERLRSLGRGGNQPNLNLNIVKNIEVLVPPIELQQKFSEIVEKVNAIKAKVQQAQELPLFDALSQQAFKGELSQ